MKKIAIIGAGLSGLCSAKIFIKEGFEVTVFEKGETLGGVWAQERSYPKVTTQTTRDEYSFSDFKMPDNYPQWPSGEQVYEYLLAYAKSFGVYENIRFNHEITSLTRNDDSWLVQYTIGNNTKIECYDFVIVCSGVFHKPKMPLYPNLKRFHESGGVVLHTSELKSTDQLKDKNVAVIGFAKSATDVACLAADYAKSSTLIYRKAQWKVPRFFGNAINLKYLLFSRLSEACFDYHSKYTIEKFLHTIGRPLVWLQWRGLEALLKWQFGLAKIKMVPEHNIEDQISCSLGVEPENFYKKIQSGKIKAIKSTVLEYQTDGLRLHSGDSVKADVVIYGTGFLQDLPFLQASYRKVLTDSKGSLHLYRGILNPDIPNLAFVGFNSSLFTTLTSEVAAHWVLAMVKRKLKLPTHAKMHEEIERVIKWRINDRPISSEFSGTCVAPFNYHHLDELLTDMKRKSRRSRNILIEYLKPINPEDYKVILENKDNKYSIK